MSPRVYANSRERILDAAERLILRDGLGRLSVDAVVAEAALSKGAFFHHFATKEAMLAAIVARLATEVDAQLGAMAAGDARPGSRLRAQIALTLEMPRAERQRLRALVLALFAAAVEGDAVAKRARAVNRQALRDAADDGVAIGNALIVTLALDGYWLGESVGTLGLDAREKSAFREALLSLLSSAAKAKKP